MENLWKIYGKIWRNNGKMMEKIMENVGKFWKNKVGKFWKNGGKWEKSGKIWGKVGKCENVEKGGKNNGKMWETVGK